ncbi:hypothetical protein EVA_15108 [gut metagenome]|uniref:Uncharacterized protein n=1 Tax=gut metagenome TaxID=749906 RepID=J9FQM2_9ZZZZ
MATSFLPKGNKRNCLPNRSRASTPSPSAVHSSDTN